MTPTPGSDRLRRSPSLFDRLSISVKVPLAAGVLVLVFGTALVTAAYVTMRSTSIRVADERLTALAKYFAESYGNATTGNVTQFKLLATNDSVANFLRDQSPGARAAATAALAARANGGRGGPFAVQLRDAQGKALLSAGSKAAWLEGSPVNDSFPRQGVDGALAVGRLQRLSDSLVYPMVLRIGGAEPSGYVVQWRVIPTSMPRLGSLMSNLLGTDGAMYFANADGSLWTDFASISPPPLRAPTRYEGLLRYERPGGRGEVLAAAAPIPGTPWMWTIEFPMRSILTPTTVFLQRLMLAALICAAIGLLLAWWMSRRLTEPLGRMTAAADAIAAGDRGQRISMQRQDELGRLGVSLDIMAAQVDESHQRLEAKVHERTEALNEALLQLQSAQEALVRREKLAMLGQLASSVGHELRNPLGVMSNAIYYLQIVLEHSSSDVKEYLGMLEHQVALSGKIVTDLLDFARVTPAQRQPIALRSLTETQLGRMPSLRGVTVEQDFPETLPLAEVDPVHAGQVVLNLVMNAVQAMGDSGGTLKLRGRWDGGRLCLEVSDSGPGVPADQADKVFEPLYTTKARGIGLGLAVSRTLAQANGGDVMLDTSRFPGATFIFLMPVVGGTA